VEVTNLRQLGSLGLKLSDGTNTGYISNESLRDSSDLGVENNGFKPIAANYASGDGFAYEETVQYAAERTLDDTLSGLAGEGYAIGDIVNSGYAKTLRVIAYRNSIINHCYNGETINGINIPLAPVSASNGKSELDVLAQRITDIKIWSREDLGYSNNEAWGRLYFPAFSACYAYEPKVSKQGQVLYSRFKAHNWFLPTVGLHGRYIWHLYIDENTPFLPSIEKGILKNSGNWVWTSTRRTYNNYWASRTDQKSVTIDFAVSSMQAVRAFCAF
jgi:hypothetical protein